MNSYASISSTISSHRQHNGPGVGLIWQSSAEQSANIVLVFQTFANWN